MKFTVTVGEKEIRVIAWLLQTRSNTHRGVFLRTAAVALVVVLVFLYDLFFYDARTTAQWVVLLILTVLCIGQTIAVNMGMVDYIKIAKKRAKSMIGEPIEYSFGTKGIWCETDKVMDMKEWDEIREWGEYDGCIFIMFRSNDAIIFDQDKYTEESMNSLKELLRSKGKFVQKNSEKCDSMKLE